MAKAARPATPATNLLPAASILALLPGVKVAGAVVADRVPDEAVPVAAEVVLATG